MLLVVYLESDRNNKKFPFIPFTAMAKHIRYVQNKGFSNQEHNMRAICTHNHKWKKPNQHSEGEMLDSQEEVEMPVRRGEKQHGDRRPLPLLTIRSWCWSRKSRGAVRGLAQAPQYRGWEGFLSSAGIINVICLQWELARIHRICLCGTAVLWYNGQRSAHQTYSRCKPLIWQLTVY